MPSKPRVIYWFRTDLRLHDSPALKAALDLKPECLYPVWCWDPHYIYRARVGPNRWQFLFDCQSDLSASITKLNPKSKLLVVREAPQTLLVKLFKAWNISHLVFEKDTDAYARERDEKIIEIAKHAGVKVIIKVGRTLYDPDELVKANGGKPTMSITQVQGAAKKLLEIPRPISAPKSIPDPGDTSLDFNKAHPPKHPDRNHHHRSGQETSYHHLAGPKDDFAVPTMTELGLKPATTPHRGGETLALAALDRIISDKDYTAKFSKPETAPTAFSPQSTTLLSPHLHFGSLSVREFYWRAQEVIVSYQKSKAATIPTNLLGQLLFREMYFGAQAALGWNFAQTYNNPNCRFIPWNLPSTISPTTNLVTGAYHINDPQAEDWFRRWKYGITGFPWIDALMRQLRAEGWIHHLGRHAVACFLTRGGCYVDWERGAEVFEHWLIDHETASNAGNWQWLSCTAFYAQFYRCYSPIAFPKKWDKQGDFVKNYVPELALYPEKFIYEPWKAPIADQKRWRCLIQGNGTATAAAASEPGVPAATTTTTYPKPMFDFAARRTICIEGLKTAYKTGFHGADQRVRDGSWRTLFPPDSEGLGHDSLDGMPQNATEYLVHAFEAMVDPHPEDEESGDGGSVDGGGGGGSGDGSADQGCEDEEGDEGGAGEDGQEAAEVGGQTKGGDHVEEGRGSRSGSKSGGKIGNGTVAQAGRERPGAGKKRKRQGTLDGDFGVAKRGH